MLSLLGERASTGWGELFRRGAQRQDPSAYPEPQAIKTVGIDLTKRLHAKLATITEDELAAPVTRRQAAERQHRWSTRWRSSRSTRPTMSASSGM